MIIAIHLSVEDGFLTFALIIIHGVKYLYVVFSRKISFFPFRCLKADFLDVSISN